VTVELTKQGHEVMVRGHAEFGATLPCVVTLDPVDFDLRPEIFLMLKPGPTERRGAEGPGPKKRRPRPGGLGGAGAPPNSKTLAPPLDKHAAPRRKKRPSAEEGEAELADDETPRDTFLGDEIVLDDFVREFLLLELPLYPRRPDLPSPEESIVSRPLAGPTGEQSIDPRLAPLAKIAERLRGAADKE
jgi:uncharacterized metal-binding protein YceD (DUF177 family)